MKRKNLLFAASLAIVMTACGGNAKTEDSAAAQNETVDSTEILKADSIAAPEAARVDSVAKADSIAKAEADAQAQQSKELDAKVDKIIGMINENISTIQQLKNDGIPSSSSMAFRATSDLPDWNSAYNKIKGQLNDEQKARIKAAEKKFNSLVASWQ